MRVRVGMRVRIGVGVWVWVRGQGGRGLRVRVWLVFLPIGLEHLALSPTLTRTPDAQ